MGKRRAKNLKRRLHQTAARSINATEQVRQAREQLKRIDKQIKDLQQEIARLEIIEDTKADATGQTTN